MEKSQDTFHADVMLGDDFILCVEAEGVQFQFDVENLAFFFLQE